MATQVNNPGLLSKVARFVRNPTKDWADLDKPGSTLEFDHSKEALKLVIERRRHDDAVRKREFAQLRKLRQASPSAKAELSQSMSSFRSTSGGADDDVNERASTLKKIDEIEAQMSRQWWKGRSGAAPLATNRPSDSASTEKDDFPSTQSSRLSSTAQGEVTQMSGSANFDFRATEPGIPDASHDSDDGLSTCSVFSASKMVSVDMGQNLSDPDMEEAAIRYANGDDVGAEAALQTALQLPDAKPEMVEAWAAALLDLYRSTGQLANFERMALNYARRFGRSAPAWAVIAQPLAANSAGVAIAAPVAGQRWDSPVALDDVAVARLRAMVKPGASTYVLNWRPVQQMSASAAGSLAELLASWCDMPLALCFEGVESLDRLLHTHTPSGEKSVPRHLWQLRFDALRLLRLQDDYELAALEFCVTFEVSPPPWREPRCQRVDGPQSKSPSVPNQTRSVEALPGAALAPELREASNELALSGEVWGDVSGIVAQWQLAAGDRGIWQVSCTRLIRVDFSAAGGLLNWVAQVTAHGSRVEFRDVPRLVAAFFHLIGINEHAQVTARTN